jgi:hypothetical protein
MRNIIISITFFVIIISCNKENSLRNSGIQIKGSIPVSSTKAKSSDTRQQNLASLSDATKVLVFSANTFSHGMIYSLVDIVKGGFNTSAQIGNATALVFLDSDNKYIGNLCTDGLNVLPLGNLSDGENTIIDLSSLTLNGNRVIPSHDPFGKEIIITPEEVACFKDIDSFYSSLAKNIDTDNNGSPDVLTQSEIVVTSLYSFEEGKWGTDNSKAVLLDTTDLTIYYQLCFQGGTGLTFSGDNFVLTGPSENPHSEIQKSFVRINPCEGVGFMAQFFLQNSFAENPQKAFRSGVYTLSLNGSRSYTINYNSLNKKKNIIVAIPTLHTNSGGKLISVSIEFKLLDGTNINPVNMISSMLIQINNINNQFASAPLTSQTGFTNYIFPNPIDISSIPSFTLTYDDLLGNRYLVDWKK